MGLSWSIKTLLAEKSALRGSKLGGLALDQETDDKTKQAQDRAKDFDDKNLNEPVKH
jgi:hypothetical protein